jgi:hypothetical protein
MVDTGYYIEYYCEQIKTKNRFLHFIGIRRFSYITRAPVNMVLYQVSIFL